MQFDVLADAHDLGFTEGPAWAPDGTLWVVSITHASLYHFDSDGRMIEQVEVGGGPNGLAIDADGTVFIAQNGGVYGGKPGLVGGIQTLKGGAVKYIVTGPDAPNDLCFGPDGMLYFTDPRGDAHPDDPSTGLPGRLYRCARDGSDLTLLWEGPGLINGLAFTPAGDALYVIETMKPQRLWKIPFNLDSGLGVAQEFHRITAGWPDGMAIDASGNIWVGNTQDCSIHVIDSAGALIDRLPLPEGSFPTNCCFGGPDLDVLYVTGSGNGTVLRADVGVKGLALRRGAPAFDELVLDEGEK